MSTHGSYLANIKAALDALPVVGTHEIGVAATIQNCFALARQKPGIFVVWGGFDQAGSLLIANPTFTPGSETWFIVIVSQTFQTWESAMKDSGDLFDLMEDVYAIRSINLAPAGRSPVFLQIASIKAVPSEAATDEGGDLAIVFVCNTTKLRL